MAGFDLLAIPACKFVYSWCRAVTSTVANFLTVDALDLNSISIFYSLLGAGAGCMAKF